MLNSCRLLSVSLAFLAAGLASAGNIVSNGTFESGLSGWSETEWYGGTDHWAANGTAHTGSFSASIAGNGTITQSFTPHTTDYIIETSFWVKQADPTYPNIVIVHYLDGSFSSESIFNADTNWTKHSLTLDSGKKISGISFSGNQGPLGEADPRFYVDDVIVDLVPEPTSMAALGLGAVALLRRRTRKQ